MAFVERTYVNDVDKWNATTANDLEQRIASGVASRVVAGGNLGAAFTLDLNDDADVTLVGTLTANLVLTIDNLVAGAIARLIITQDGTGGRTLTIEADGDSHVVSIPSTAGSTFGLEVIYDGTDVFLLSTQGPPGADGVDGIDGVDGTDADNTAVLNLLSASGVGVIVHGATAGTARPTDFEIYIWIGTVEPTNMAVNDIGIGW